MKPKPYKDTLKSIRKYKCPFCEADGADITYGSIDVEGQLVYQHAFCDTCEHQWDENYVFVGINNTSAPIEEGLASVTLIPELLTTVLNDKSLLPILMGIDPAFDKLIEEKLKEI